MTSSGIYTTPHGNESLFLRGHLTTPSTASSTKSLVHSGHRVSSGKKPTIQEKSSPISAIPSGFKRVVVTPTRIDSESQESSSTYDAILKRITEKVQIGEQNQLLKGVGSMFDDDEDHDHGTGSREHSESEQQVLVVDYANGPSDDDTDNNPLFDNSRAPTVPVVGDDHFVRQDCSVSWKSSSRGWMDILASAAALVSNETGDDKPLEKLEDSLISNSNEIPVHTREHTLAATQQFISSSVSFEKGVVFPSMQQKDSYVDKEKLQQILPEYKQSLEFLRTIDQEFFPDHEDPEQLLQRFLLLSVDSVRELVFAQHDEFVAKGLFDGHESTS